MAGSSTVIKGLPAQLHDAALQTVQGFSGHFGRGIQSLQQPPLSVRKLLDCFYPLSLLYVNIHKYIETEVLFGDSAVTFLSHLYSLARPCQQALVTACSTSR